MTDYTKLVEALRCCISKNPPETCVGCTYSKCNNECAVRRMILDAAAAIEELQAKVDRLTKENRELAADRPEMEEVNGHWEWRKPNGEVLMPNRGEWIYHPKDAIEMMFTLPKCSICGHESSDTLNYCPNCGAKMEVQDGNSR